MIHRRAVGMGLMRFLTLDRHSVNRARIRERRIFRTCHARIFAMIVRLEWSMADLDLRDLDRWCREVMPELATFYAACEYRTRKRAGQKLGKEGQSVGRSISRLEVLLKDSLGGGSLVSPEKPREVKATDAGRALLEYWKDIVSLRLGLLEKLSTLQRGSEIRAATTNYAWLAYGDALEHAYKKRRTDGVVSPGNKFYGRDRVWEDVEKQVLEGNADIGIYSFPPSRQKEFPKDLGCLNWMEEEIVLVLSPDLARKAKKEKVSVYELSLRLPSMPRIVHYARELGFDRTDAIEDYLRRQNVLRRYEEDWLLGVNSIAEIKDTLIKKGGISFLPWPTVEEEHQKKTLHAYPLNSYMRPRVIKIIYRLHGLRSAVQDFCDAAETLRGIRNFPIQTPA